MQKTVIVILGSALVSFLPRFLPMYYLTRQKIPPLVTAWLRYIPVAVLSALVVPGILTSDGRLFFSFENSYLLATIHPCRYYGGVFEKHGPDNHSRHGGGFSAAVFSVVLQGRRACIIKR